MLEFFRTSLLVAGGIPLIMYPFAMMASLSGLGSRDAFFLIARKSR